MNRFGRYLILLLLADLACSSMSRNSTPYQNRVANQQRKRAAFYMETGYFADAAATLDSLTREFPRDDELFTRLGDAHRGAGNYDGAVKAYEQAIRLNYGAYEPHMKLGVLLMEHGRTGRALTEFEVAVKYSERDALAHYNYGLALHEMGRRDEALAQWRIAAELDPTDARAAEAEGMGWSGVNDSTAVRSFERARELGADGASFHNNYALALERLGRNEEAESHFVAAVARAASDEKRHEYRRNLAVHHLRAGRAEEAAREFEELVAQGGGKWSDTVYLARARVRLKRFDDALQVLEPFALDLEADRIDRTSPRVDRMPPTLDEALDVLGMAWRGKGDRAKAVEYLKRAVALRPDDTSHLNNYGVVLAEGGMLPEARAQWRRVLELDPGNATARANLSAFGP
jgi:Flp pilus assembly protein TadD